MLGAITFLAALAIAALYTKYITRSILKVSEVSKKMANLDFRVRYTEDRRDEIGILGENLNELSEKLESALDELKEKNTAILNKKSGEVVYTPDSGNVATGTTTNGFFFSCFA